MQYGIDLVEQNLSSFKNLRLALICNATSVSSGGEYSIDLLRKKTDLKLLLAPEHGVRGDKAAGEAFGNEVDSDTGLEIASLYAANGQGLPEEKLEGIDALIYDIQDVGMRCYTYISSLYQALHYASKAHKRLIVLDRPNPLGRKIEGLVLEDQFRSFVGIYSLTSRYGLTAGEFACLVKEEENLPLDLVVIKCDSYDPNLLFPSLEKTWVKPSPAIPAFENALLYSAFHLLEATNVSEGRGTESPFTILGAPFIDSEKLAKTMNELGLKGLVFLPHTFTPTSSKYSSQECHGVKVKVLDYEAFNGIRTGLTLLKTLNALYPESFSYLPSSNGFTVKLEKLLGTNKDIGFIEANNWAYLRENEKAFLERAKKVWLY